MEYLQNLYEGTNGEGYLAVWCKLSKSTKCFAANDLEAAEHFMAEQGRDTDIYHGWCLIGEVPEYGRGRSKDVVFSPGIMFDADLYSVEPNVHSQNCLPKSLDEVMDWLLEAEIPKPSHIRSSGNGLYLDWLHDGGVLLKSDDERNEYAANVKQFHQALRQSASDLRGWKFDATHDLARVTRMPGTLNHKTNPPKPVELLQ
ncbi:hypothetical protein [Hyphococcus sp. DH-69]|uniref:hypothetical protein n=1 Tax=Hyphococcus formosus TaxID=3143534 RepID=UPI00398A8588